MKAKYVVMVLGLTGLAGCSSDPVGNGGTGVLVVETEASGENIPQFSTLHIEGLPSEEILTDLAQFVTAPIATGPREVRLDVAANCTVADNPRTVDVEEGAGTITTFLPACS